MTVGVNLGDSSQTVGFDSNVTLKTPVLVSGAQTMRSECRSVNIYGSGNYSTMGTSAFREVF